MEYTDRMYSEVIQYLFGITLNTEEEIDDFYENIEENLSIEQMEKLQTEMANMLHRGRSIPSSGKPEETEESTIVNDCPKIHQIKKFEKISS